MLPAMRLPLLFAFGTLALAAVSGCGPRRPAGPPPPPFERIVVAILPFDNASASMDAPKALRSNLYVRIGRKGYLLQPLPETDSKLQAMGIQMGGQIKGVEPKELREKLGADFALWGTMHAASSTVTGIYNRRNLEADIVLTDLRSGKVIWTDRQKIVTDDTNLKAKTGLDVLGGVVAGAIQHDMKKEHNALADVFASRFPWCPRQAPPPPPPPPADPAAPGAPAPAPSSK